MGQITEMLPRKKNSYEDEGKLRARVKNKEGTNVRPLCQFFMVGDFLCGIENEWLSLFPKSSTMR